MYNQCVACRQALGPRWDQLSPQYPQLLASPDGVEVLNVEAHHLQPALSISHLAMVVGVTQDVSTGSVALLLQVRTMRTIGQGVAESNKGASNSAAMVRVPAGMSVKLLGAGNAALPIFAS